jgi:hypothetical protein
MLYNINRLPTENSTVVETHGLSKRIQIIGKFGVFPKETS